MRRFVLGFCFEQRSLSWVTLIRKATSVVPGHVGKLNGVGGHVEPGETPARAMSREFREKAGCGEELDWRQFAVLRVGDCEVAAFCATTTLWTSWPSWRGPEGDVDTYRVSEVVADGCSRGVLVVPDVRWLVPMALCHLAGRGRGHYEVRERPGEPAPGAADPGGGGGEIGPGSSEPCLGCGKVGVGHGYCGECRGRCRANEDRAEIVVDVCLGCGRRGMGFGFCHACVVSEVRALPVLLARKSDDPESGGNHE